MVNHKVCHLQQRLVTINLYARFEVTLRVHLHESFKEAPLEQTFPTNTKTTLRDIINPILPQARTFIFSFGMFGASLALFMSTLQKQQFCSPDQETHCEGVGTPLLTRSHFGEVQAIGQDLAGYNLSVARGWESKSVEEQQAQAVSPSGPAPPPLTPAQIASQRQRTGLMLSRQHVLQQLEAAQNPRHRQILQSALADLDARLARLV
jgi:hypothetical protein